MTPSRSHSSEAGERLLFLRKFLRHGVRVASVTPSSRSLSEAMCLRIDPRRPQTIVELGAGTGAVTRVAAGRMHPGSTLVAVERDPDFAEQLRARCRRANVVCADAEALHGALESLGVQSIDRLISGLPTPSLPKRTNAAVLDCYRALAAEDAWYSQLTVMPYVYRPLYRRLFEHVAFDLVMRNIPPGGVYHCRGLRSDYRDNLPGKS